MDNQIIHRDQSPFDIVPPSVSRLDAWFRDRIATARSPSEVDRLLASKLRIKRQLATVPPAIIDREAQRWLATLSVE